MVRHATSADAARVGELASQWGYVVTQDRVVATLAVPSTSLAVFEHEGQVQGWIELRITYAMESGERAEIVGLVVDQAARRKGVGKHLVDFARGWAREKGIQTLLVRSRKSRVEAHAFYPAVGFEVVKEQTVFQARL